MLADKVRVQRARRVWVDVPPEIFREAFVYAVTAMQFDKLSTITGLDEGETLGLIYHLAGPGGTVLNVHIKGCALQNSLTSPTVEQV